jgi:homoserine O-acetyltransferase
MNERDGSVGIVKTHYATFEELRLENGETISPLTLAYETYGKLNGDKSNAILICHALSGDAHAAGKHRKNSKKYGWYDIAIGPGKPFDTNNYFVICSNIIGGCKGSTGPSSIDPKTGEPYGLRFPTITVRDMAAAEKKLVDGFGIKRLFCVTGASLGGMQALQWAVDYPDSVANAVVIAAAAKQYPLGIAFHEVGRQAILNDPKWNNGDYAKQPYNGLSLARQVGHITYLSQELLERKFGRNRRRVGRNGKSKFGIEYDIQSYLRYKGRHFVGRFDANSYLYITWAIDNFDLTRGGQIRLRDVFRGVRTKFLIVSFSSDWLYPPEQNREIADALSEAGVPNVYRNLDLPYGHDSFLVYNNTLGNVIVDFLEEERGHQGLAQGSYSKEQLVRICPAAGG